MHRLLAPLAALFFAASASASPVRLPSPEDAGTSEEAIARAATMIRGYAAERRLILLGEFHGTREIPRLVARLADGYAAEGPVRVALEVDHREQDAIDAFLRSDGGTDARAALEQRRFWQRPDDQHSALATHDVLDLIDAVRSLRARGRDVAVLAYDVSTDAPRPDPDWRDRAMAASVRTAFDALPRGRLLMLTGNVHAMKRRLGYLPAAAPLPAGVHLAPLQPFSVRITAHAGYSWGCARRPCGPAPADGHDAASGRRAGEYDALVVLPAFSVARLMGAQPGR